ncbi:MAG: RnfABCDGE type electron transport complex subunit B [Clostridia bacterium]|nr:RnfABCDGE type electron transport complex subunit B [Clostridia bacterium]
MSSLLLQSINTATLFTVIGIVAVIAVIFAVLIVLVSKLCFVQEDEKATAVSEHLAGANCGGCGFAGCSDFAKALAEGKANINDCGATSSESKEEIAKILGVPYSATAKTFAVVKCAGGKNSVNKFEYVGNYGCTNEISFVGGSKLCSEGCLGGGTCVASCTEGGIKIADGVAIIDKALCKSCGACVVKCPKNIIELIPAKSRVYVACSTSCRGKDVMNACKVGCIGCGLCAKNCTQGAITMVNNLPVIDYDKCSGCKVCVSKCPRKCIREL